MSMEQIIEHVSARSGLDRPTSRRICDAIVEVLGACVPRPRELARWLPDELGAQLVRGEGAAIGDLDGFYHAAVRALRIPRSPAIELAQSVCAALAETLDPEARRMVTSRLPPDIAELVVPRRLPGAHARPVRAGDRTLAGGHPGAAHPLSTSAPRRAQRDSVGREVPHRESKLSTGHASTDEDDQTLAGGRPGSDRPLSGR